jgi:hypothetical protein
MQFQRDGDQEKALTFLKSHSLYITIFCIAVAILRLRILQIITVLDMVVQVEVLNIATL